MNSSDVCSNSDSEMSVDSDYSSGGSGHSSPFPAAAGYHAQQPAAVLYYLVVPPGYHLEFFPVEQSLPEPSSLAYQTENPADEIALTELPAPRSQRRSTFHRRLIKWSLPPPPVHPTNLPGWCPTPYGLEKYWQFAFAWFFRPYLATHQHLWTLEPVELPPVSAEWPWHSFSYLAKVHFKCPVARHPGWTSKKGLVNFWFRLRRQGEETVCEVLFKPYGQQCRKCNQGTLAQQSAFLPALWYPEFVEAAVRSLSINVDQVYYGSSSAEERSRTSDTGFIRLSSGRNSRLPHDSSRCQACIEGMCVFASHHRF